MTERWVNGLLRKELDKHARKRGGVTANWLELHEIAVTLLARQHRAFVRMVKKYRDADKLNLCRKVACNDILAALAKQGGKK